MSQPSIQSILTSSSVSGGEISYEKMETKRFKQKKHTILKCERRVNKILHAKKLSKKEGN